jgi:hypothetical protein
MDRGQACIKYVREFNNFIAKRMTCETDEVSRYLALFYTMTRDFLVNSNSGSIGNPIPQQYMYAKMALAFKMAG